MARGIQRREISAQAGTDQRYGATVSSALDYVELACDSEMFEVAVGQVRNLQFDSMLSQTVTEVARLLGARAAGESVKIKECYFLAGPD